MTRPLYPELAPIAIISAFLPLICLPWHWKARNMATLSIIAWLIVTNLIYGIDAILWGNNLEIKAKIWCDISTKLIIGASFALPSSSFCVAIFVEHIAAARTNQFIIGNKKHRDIFDLVISFGLPMIFMALHFVVQGHRFDITKGYGCRPATYVSIPGLLIVWIPPVLISACTLICAVSTLYHIITQRRSLKLSNVMPINRWTNTFNIQLMLVVFVELVWTVLLTSWTLAATILYSPIRTWDTWDNVHFHFSRIALYNPAFYPQSTERIVYLNYWFVPVSTWIFVSLFAFGSNAMAHYKMCFYWIRNRFSKSSRLGPMKVADDLEGPGEIITISH